MTAVVVDASAIVEVVRQSDDAPAVENSIGEDQPHAPSHVDAEVLTALRNLELRGELEPDRAKLAVLDLVSMNLERVPYVHLAPQAWDLRHNVTAADALYVVLARHLRAPLVTADRRLARAPKLGVELRLVG